MSLGSYAVPKYVTVDGLKYFADPDTKEASLVANNYSGDIIVPESFSYDGIIYTVTSFADACFENCSELKSVTISGRPVDPAAKYRIATVDYVAHGNDKLVAFKSATDLHFPTEEEALTREVMIKYVKEMAAKGLPVSSSIEGRIIMEE